MAVDVPQRVVCDVLVGGCPACTLITFTGEVRVTLDQSGLNLKLATLNEIVEVLARLSEMRVRTDHIIVGQHRVDVTWTEMTPADSQREPNYYDWVITDISRIGD